MTIVQRLRVLSQAIKSGVVVAGFMLLGWFWNQEDQQFYSAWFLVCVVVVFLSFVLKNYIIKNASASERKTLREAGLIT